MLLFLQWSDSEGEVSSPVGVMGSTMAGPDTVSDEGIGSDICQESRSWLADHVLCPYWEERKQSRDLPSPTPSAHSSCYLAEKWWVESATPPHSCYSTNKIVGQLTCPAVTHSISWAQLSTYLRAILLGRHYGKCASGIVQVL